MKKFISVILSVVILGGIVGYLLTGCSDKKASTPKTKIDTLASHLADGKPINGKVADAIATTAYGLNTSEKHCVVVLAKNTADVTQRINTNVTFVDEAGKTISVSSTEKRAVAPQQTVALSVKCDVRFDRFVYAIGAVKDTGFVSANSDIAFTYGITDNNCLIKVANNGIEPIGSPVVDVLFFKEKTLVDFSSTPVTQEKEDLKSGASVEVSTVSIAEFDATIIYVTGQIDHK